MGLIEKFKAKFPYARTPLQKAIAGVLGNNDELYAFPSEPFYSTDHVKRYNLDIPTKPIAITYPETNEQISALVKLAATQGLKVQAKCGGHSYCNFSSPEGGMVVDLQNLQKFEMDTETWNCRVGGGTLLGDLTKRMYEPHKRVMAHGTCPQVGIGGHATIGGLGPSSRMWGAALDHILEVEMIVANGDVVRANEKENADLFFAVKGAAAGFGIVTEFLMKTHPSPEDMVQYSYRLTASSWEDMSKTFKAWQDYVSHPDMTRKLSSNAIITELGLLIAVTYFGTKEEFEALNFDANFPGNQSSKTIKFESYLGLVLHWAEDVALEFGGNLPVHAYTKTLTFNQCNRIPNEAIDKLFHYFDTVDTGSFTWFCIFDTAGGATSDIPDDATAYAHRSALFYMQSYAFDLVKPISDKTKKFMQGLSKTLSDGMAEAGRPNTLGSYPGYVDMDLGAGAQKAYWGSNLPRLEQIKAEWDPKDLFSNPQSVRPAGWVEPEVEKPVVKKENWIIALFKRCFS